MVSEVVECFQLSLTKAISWIFAFIFGISNGNTISIRMNKEVRHKPYLRLFLILLATKQHQILNKKLLTAVLHFEAFYPNTNAWLYCINILIPTYYLLRKSPYSVRIQENTDQKKLRIWALFKQCIFILICQPQQITQNDLNLYKNGYPQEKSFSKKDLLQIETTLPSDMHVICTYVAMFFTFICHFYQLKFSPLAMQTILYFQVLWR